MDQVEAGMFQKAPFTQDMELRLSSNPRMLCEHSICSEQVPRIVWLVPLGRVLRILCEQGLVFLCQRMKAASRSMCCGQSDPNSYRWVPVDRKNKHQFFLSNEPNFKEAD